jgi:hypothetical protein
MRKTVGRASENDGQQAEQHASSPAPQGPSSAEFEFFQSWALAALGMKSWAPDDTRLVA